MERNYSELSTEELAAMGLVPTMWDMLAEARTAAREAFDVETPEKTKPGKPESTAEPSTSKQKE
jgi:hypothetical protein